jgi:hypothetical protein
MWPWVSKMTPEPWPLAELLVTEMATTLGETAPAVTAQLGANGLACSTGAGEVGALPKVCTVGADVTSVRVSP